MRLAYKVELHRVEKIGKNDTIKDTIAPLPHKTRITAVTEMKTRHEKTMMKFMMHWGLYDILENSVN